ncbi:GGDEF domain-containing protein [Devosia sp.]|uniref:GGDEF domain-containing protein n=1 Tax=Devosia sp. TaxID=1871048 RepID=UPI002FCC5506
MFFRFTDHSGALPAIAATRPDEHTGIKKIGRLVLLCAGVLLVTAALLIGSALQILHTIDRADLDAERLRAANAIDAISDHNGSLTEAGVDLLARTTGLRDVHLSSEISTDSRIQQIPLLAGLGPSGSFLTWTRASRADDLFRGYAPIRIPIIGGLLLVVFLLLVRLRALVADIERQRRLAHQQSRSDVLTGLANRLAFETALAELTSGARPFAIIAFDLDGFKKINDSFGHAAGDDVLRTVASRLSGLLHSGELLARFGGDEFVLLTTSRVDTVALSELARDCIALIEAPIEFPGISVSVGISLGIVLASTPHNVPASLVAQADDALYRAKSSQGSSFCFAGDEPAPPQLRASA